MQADKIEERLQQLEAHKNSVDTWWRTQSATMALLKHAYATIEDAEARIKRLESLASTDEMTGLLNRRGFDSFFERELARIKRHNSAGGLFILIDLDRFKEINDTYGHLAGDACLRLVGQKINSVIRTTDGAGRLGGDELVILLTQVSPDDAMRKARKIQKTLNDMTLDWQGEQIHFGASIGMESYDSTSLAEVVYQAADLALYADKQARRARAVRVQKALK